MEGLNQEVFISSCTVSKVSNGRYVSLFSDLMIY